MRDRELAKIQRQSEEAKLFPMELIKNNSSASFADLALPMPNDQTYRENEYRSATN